MSLFLVPLLNSDEFCNGQYFQVPGSNMLVSRQSRVSSGRTLQKRLNAKNLAILPPVGNNSKNHIYRYLQICFSAKLAKNV